MKRRFLQALSELLPERVSIASTDRAAYSRDLWPLLTLKMRGGEAARRPAAVIWPQTEGEIQAVIALCAAHGVPLVPFGGGSGVLGGAAPTSGGVVMDLKRMDRILDLDEAGAWVRVEPGINGQLLEDALNQRGFTLGHFPSSIMLATVGGYIATRSAGQLSSRYGKIEDMVRAFVLIDGRGERHTFPCRPGDSAYGQLFIGSEGTLGIFTEVTLAISPLPPLARYRGVRFPTVSAGLEAMRRIMQSGLEPSVLRLYDEIDTVMALKRAGDPGEGPLPPSTSAPPASPAGVSWPGIDAKPTEAPLGKPRGTRPVRDLLQRLGLQSSAVKAALGRSELLDRLTDVLPESALLILGTEGEPEDAIASEAAALAICRACHGEDLGAGPGERWLAHRYSVSYKMTRVFQLGAFVDTCEVAATWERIPHLYQAVRDAVSRHGGLMAHFSHAYPEGTSIYFSMAGVGEGPEDSQAVYGRMWEAAMEATLKAGGTISHHHGVGQHKAPWATREKGAWLIAYARLKAEFDPHGILNPGKLVTARQRAPGSEAP